MSVKHKPPSAPAPLLRNSGTAPFICFDAVPVYGVSSGGGVEIELAARVLIPRPDGQGVITEACCTGHLRCTIAGAMGLLDALTKVIDMATKGAAHKPGDGADDDLPTLHS